MFKTYVRAKQLAELDLRLVWPDYQAQETTILKWKRNVYVAIKL